jgi:hypothetical protein
MELLCNNCGAIVNAQDVNIATDLAKCSTCNTLMRASELKEYVDTADLLVLPANAQVTMEQGRNKSIVLTAPANGLSGESIGISIFSVFWLGFVAVWTTLASFGSIFFALFSIPFWVVGIFMAKSAINKIFETQRVTFNDYEVTIELIRPVFSGKTTIDKKDIIDIKYTDVTSAGPLASFAQMGANGKRTGKVLEYPAIVTKQKTHFFFQNLPEADQKWTVQLLKHLLVGN